MAQHDYVISNQGFASYRSDHNSSLSAIVSNNSGATEPTTTYAYQWWYDETTDILKMRNADNDAWITMFTFDQTADTYSLATDVELTITENLDLIGSATISGDLTVDTDTLYVDSTNNRVGVGTTSPADGLDVQVSGLSTETISGNTTTKIARFEDNDATNDGLRFLMDDTNNVFYIHRIDNGGDLAFSTRSGGTNLERLRIDDAGNLTVGSTSDPQNHVIQSSQGSVLTIVSGGTLGGGIALADANSTANANRIRAEGDDLTFDTAGSEALRIYSSGNVKITNGIIHGGGSGINMASSRLLPTDSSGTVNDNVNDCGGPSNRWDDIYATSGTVNASDENEKQSIQSLTASEMAVAKRISKLFKTYKWNSAVEKKGDNARTHTGIIAQDVQQAFADEGLDAGNYGMFCSDTWWEKEISVDAVAEELDEEGNIIVEGKDAYTYIDTKDEETEGYTEKTRLGIRYPELLSFVSSAFEQRLTDIETRLTALEA